MSEFEFQRFVTIGQFLPASSVLHRLDARTRILGGLLLVVAISAAPNVAGLAVAVVALTLLCLAARIPLRYAIKGILVPLPFILVLVVIQVIFGPGGDIRPWVVAGPVRISPTSAINGLKLLLRFPALILALTLLSATTSATDAVHGLEALLRPLARLGLPVQDLVLMLQVTMRFLPLLALEAERIAKSQASRGGEWGTGPRGVLRRVRQTLPLLVPLFLVGLRRAESLAVAIEARGYRGQTPRTSMANLRYEAHDALALVLAIALALAMVLI